MKELILYFVVFIVFLTGSGWLYSMQQDAAFTSDQLKRHVETLESTAGEGGLLLQQLQAQKITPTFARIHAEDLQKNTTDVIATLQHANAPAALQKKLSSASSLAKQLQSATVQMTETQTISSLKSIEHTLRQIEEQSRALGTSL